MMQSQFVRIQLHCYTVCLLVNCLYDMIHTAIRSPLYKIPKYLGFQQEIHLLFKIVNSAWQSIHHVHIFLFGQSSFHQKRMKYHSIDDVELPSNKAQ